MQWDKRKALTSAETEEFLSERECAVQTVVAACFEDAEQKTKTHCVG